MCTKRLGEFWGGSSGSGSGSSSGEWQWQWQWRVAVKYKVLSMYANFNVVVSCYLLALTS